MSSGLSSGVADHGTPSEKAPEFILADLARTFTFASHQNSVPVLRSLAINNPLPETLESISLELVAHPGFLRAKTWKIDRILPGEKIELSDRRVDLDAKYLSGLNEAERGDVTLRLVNGATTLQESTIQVRLLARDEWGGVADMAQLLPSFVMPNDPAIARILKVTADFLHRYGHSSSLDGYQSNSPQRAFTISAAVYSAVASLNLHYAEPPVSFEQRGQKVRKPSRVSEESLATCLDLTVLFAAALEGAGLNPIILLFDGHAAVGVWLVKRTLPNTIEPDAAEIRKALKSKELIVFETTGVTKRPPMPFPQAQSHAAFQLVENSPLRFVSAVDVSRSRIGGIHPLASHEASKIHGNAGDNSPTELPLPVAPEFGEIPTETVEVKPSTAAGRIDRWQAKLLDLSRRNRLISVSDSKRLVSFLCSDVALLEDQLATGAKIRLISLPEQNPLGERDSELFREKHGHDIHQEFADQALQKGELASPLNARELDARLTALYRQARSDIAEGGTNTLFLTAGVLKWADKENKVRRAPLLLFPVKLERASAKSRFLLSFHEDDASLNLTLIQFLKREFDLSLPDFKGGLPKTSDGKDIDVRAVFEIFRKAVRDVPGFEIAEETAISTFSFAKYLMWKDLVDRTAALRENRVVKHLIDNPEQIFEGADIPFPSESAIDVEYPLEEQVLPLPADSSQIAACLAAAQGRDFIIVGPPGTGKSQTIANIIATILAKGRRVLFVAEKTAALNVVYRRLEERGLAEHCLELHSNKADRKHFLEQLRRSWEKGSNKSQTQWVLLNQKLSVRRDQLNAYVKALHEPAENGMSIYHAIGLATSQSSSYSPSFEWTGPHVHDGETYRSLEELSEQLGRVYDGVKVKPALQLVDVREWSAAWQTTLLSAAQALESSVRQAQESLLQWSTRLNVSAISSAKFEGLEYFATLARNVIATSGINFDVILERNFSLLSKALSDMEVAIASYRQLETELSAPYPREEVARIPIDEIDRDWRLASAAIWPKSWLAKRRIRKILASYAGVKVVDPSNDIPLIRDMQSTTSSIGTNHLAATSLPIDGLDTNTEYLRNHLGMAEEFRNSIVRLGQFAGNMQGVAESVASVLRGDVNLPYVKDAEVFLEKYNLLTGNIENFENVAGIRLFKDNDSFLADLSDQLVELQKARSMLRDWSSWCQVRSRAEAQGLSPLIRDLEAGAIEAKFSLNAFRLGYARWWLPLIIDETRAILDFRQFEHESRIEEFRTLDEVVRAAAATRVHDAVIHKLPQMSLVPRNSELGKLRHQINLTRPSTSIRDMIGAMPESFGKLAPCVLMSPLSIAQYLPTNQELFDVVVFDEASQISTWDAVGAVARARQTIIVGDPKQLPPTNFFGTNREDDDDSVSEFEKDLESILDEAKTSGLPSLHLRWHYRSRHESLIAFSNWHYYNNSLITFPSPVTQDRAVSLEHIPNGIYDRGKSRTNRDEALAIVRRVATYLDSWLSLPEEDRQTLGVITFNSQQQALIQDLLDDLLRDRPEFEWFFSEDRYEPLIVKNLENMQGDERDVIFFSITFSRDSAGRFPMDFGAINKDGGERRLNVAVSRARRELVVFSGFLADEVDLERTRKTGPAHLKTFLDYAVRGPVALPAQDKGSLGATESPFEVAVKDALELRGWQVTTQVGVSAFRIDLGVKHPDLAGAFLAGVECDGATYHSSATARDRDKIREQVLVGLGWTILRVWSTDWWFNPQEALDRLDAALNEALAKSREKLKADISNALETVEQLTNSSG